MLSNKLTFSLASLVVIIAIGLVLSVTPAIGQTDITFDISAATMAKDFVVVVPTAVLINGTAPNMITAEVNDVAASSWGEEFNLADFFTNGGGTIQLIGPRSNTNGGDFTAQAKKEVVISEIMWGSDLIGANASERRASQWIELYVRTAITDTGTSTEWTLRFTPNELVRDAVGTKLQEVGAGTDATTDDQFATLVDVMSNWGLGNWAIVEDGAYGQSGNEFDPAGDNGSPAVPAKRRISMYRDIDYTGAEKAAMAAAAPVATTTKTAAEVMADELDKAIAAMKDGTRSGNWKESAAPRGKFQGGTVFASPGEPHFQGFVSAGSPTVVARAGIIFSEIANRITPTKTNKSEGDWIELYNNGTASVNVVGYTLSTIQADLGAPEDNDADAHNAMDKPLFTIEHPDGDPINVDPGEYLLLLSKDPAETGIAVGTDVTNDDIEARVASSYYVDEDLDLPDDAGFTLILRTVKDKPGSADLATIADIAVGKDGYFGLVDDDPVYNTDVWPLASTQAGVIDDLVLHDNTWLRLQTDASLFGGDVWKSDGALTGLGVDRNSGLTGSPGFANDGTKAEFADATGKAVYTGTITISEIMVAQTRRNLPQWIELFNSSMTQAIDIDGWELDIQNVDSDDLDAREAVSLKIKGALIIGPRQSVLIASTSTNNASDNIPTVYSLYTEHRDKFEMTRRSDSVLSIEGFYISLSDARGVEADSIGNIDSKGVVEWEIPMAEDGRSSITRRYDNGVAEDGTTQAAWVLTSETDNFSEEYYGRSSDMGSPGDRKGGVLPVSLSSFRPVRDQTTGEVVIRWITQSELNNAGFNILRSETKKGEFKVVNLKGIIAGHGTTSEKHVYEWKDTTAKPNVVYYYQIEDVSLDGKRTRLAQTHLRGNVNAAGKAAVRWGELKLQR